MLQENRVYSFVYHGGSHPGRLRRVCVLSNDGANSLCWDFDLGEFRRFYHNKISNVGGVKGAFSIKNIDKLPDWFSDAAKEACENEGWYCLETDENTMVFCPE